MQANSTASALVNPFSGFFDAQRSQYDIDLSRSTLLSVMDAYETHKQKLNPQYESGSVKLHLAQIQVLTGHILMPYDVTDNFYMTLSAYLTELGVRYSSQETYLAKIRTALEWGTRHRCPVSSTYDCYELPKSTTFTIALTPDEVSHIAHFNCKTLPYRSQRIRVLERVRDMFVLSCQLGQRHSDMIRISKENFNRNIFSCTQQKTGNKAKLDIDDFAIMPQVTYRILEKYDYNAPYAASIGNYNHNLHNLLKCIGEEFNQTYKIEEKVNGKIVTIEKAKWELVASHTARRTFVTYHAFRNVPLATLSKATGHSQISSLQHYIKFNED